jgi:hypothetical protein
MAESNSRRKTSPKVASVTPKPDTKPDTKAPAPLYASNIRADASPEEIRQLIAEAAYYRAMERGFEPGHELEDWIQAEAEVMGRLNAGGR